ncbi:MAG: HemK/PrmC family methyltransferase [Candidatus Moraniibacteriota bacterium]
MTTLRTIAKDYAGRVAPEDFTLLAAFALGQTKEFIFREPGYELSEEEASALNSYLDHRAAHEPVAYTIGEKEFFGLPFFVTRDTLVPRPETELLVEEALTLLSKHDDKTVIADLGTGSGAIIISLAHSLQKKYPKPTSYTFIATDISSAALDVAKRNAERNSIHKTVISDKPIPSNFDQISDGSCFTNPSPGIPGTPFPKGRNSGLCTSEEEDSSPLEKGSPESPKGGIFTSASTVVQSNSSLEKRFDIDFFEGNLLDPVPENTFGDANRIFILANLPYLSYELYESAPDDVRLYEPISALVADKDGLALYIKSLDDIAQRKKSVWKNIPVDGLFEISPEQESSLKKIFLDRFPSSQNDFLPDLSGRTRIFRFHIDDLI